MKQLAVTLSLLMISVFAWAAGESGQPTVVFDPVPEPPTIPSTVKSGKILEPDVRIIESENRRVETYSANGRVYMVKITPRGNFPPYYLIDSDGDGTLDVKSSYHHPFPVPQWRLYSW